MRIGRVEITDVKEDGRFKRPFCFTVRTLAKDGSPVYVEHHRNYTAESARIERTAKITQLQSAQRRARKPRKKS